MNYISNLKRIDPAQYPLVKDESWWFISPNDGESELVIPPDAVIMCIADGLEDFVSGDVYRVVDTDDHYGWVRIQYGEIIIEMPPYVVARYFDIEPFIRGRRRPLATFGENPGGFDPEQIFKDLEKAHGAQTKTDCSGIPSGIRFK